MPRLLALLICVLYFIALEVLAIIAMIVCLPFCFFQDDLNCFTVIRHLFFKHSIMVMKYFYPRIYQLEKDQAKAFSDDRFYL